MNSMSELARLGRRTVTGAALGLAVSAAPAVAQDWPTESVRIVVPIAPGSVTDTLIRTTADRLSRELGQPFVIDNRPGAALIIGATECANSEPDGHTLCLATHSVMAFNPLLMTDLPYDAAALEPIMPLYLIGEGLLVPTALGVDTVEELKAMAVEDSSRLNFATIGGGSLPDLFLRWLNEEWGTEIAGIAYGGGGPILQALAQNESQIAVIGLGNYVPMEETGTVKLLAVEAPERSPLFPETPTFIEAGLGDWLAPAFWGLFAPPGTPEESLDAIHAAFSALYEDPAYVKSLEDSGMAPLTMSREEFASFLADYQDTARDLIARANLTPTAYESQ